MRPAQARRKGKGLLRRRNGIATLTAVSNVSRAAGKSNLACCA
jgi:hypothetical protein